MDVVQWRRAWLWFPASLHWSQWHTPVIPPNHSHPQLPRDFEVSVTRVQVSPRTLPPKKIQQDGLAVEKPFAAKPYDLSLIPRTRGEMRELTPASCALPAKHAFWYVSVWTGEHLDVLKWQCAMTKRCCFKRSSNGLLQQLQVTHRACCTSCPCSSSGPGSPLPYSAPSSVGLSDSWVKCTWEDRATAFLTS